MILSAKSQGQLQSRESVENQNKWHHLIHYSFPKPANDKLLVLLIGIDNAELHHSHVDLRVKNGGRGCAKLNQFYNIFSTLTNKGTLPPAMNVLNFPFSFPVYLSINFSIVFSFLYY